MPRRRARRSCLSVPASEPRFHAKANECRADEIFLDLEDSVAPSAKVEARARVVEALRTYPYAGKTRVVRVNARDTEWCADDIHAVVSGAGDRIDCLMLPKVESVDDVRWADALLTDLERASSLGRRIGLELQIESARGLDRVSDIAAASERSETLVLGPGDLMASLETPELRVGGIVSEYPGDFWHYFLARIVVAARANGLQPIDGPYGAVRDLDGLRVAARRSALLGCDGKWALTPGQIEVINEAFTPLKEDVARAVAILDAYRAATDERRTGAVMLAGEMIDEASRKMAQVIVERARLFGLLGN